MRHKMRPYRNLRLFRFFFLVPAKNPYTYREYDQYTQINYIFRNDGHRADCGCNAKYHKNVEDIRTDRVAKCHINFILLAATIEVTSSGREVPMETMVSPIRVWLIPRSPAILAAASTVTSPPTAMATAPPTMNTILFGTESSLMSSSEPPSISTFFLRGLPLRQSEPCRQCNLQRIQLRSRRPGDRASYRIYRRVR